MLDNFLKQQFDWTVVEIKPQFMALMHYCYIITLESQLKHMFSKKKSKCMALFD